MMRAPLIAADLAGEPKMRVHAGEAKPKFFLRDGFATFVLARQTTAFCRARDRCTANAAAHPTLPNTASSMVGLPSILNSLFGKQLGHDRIGIRHWPFRTIFADGLQIHRSHSVAARITDVTFVLPACAIRFPKVPGDYPFDAGSVDLSVNCPHMPLRYPRKEVVLTNILRTSENPMAGHSAPGDRW
jgi:hypothetical protein